LGMVNHPPSKRCSGTVHDVLETSLNWKQETIHQASAAAAQCMVF
jgi:hypothetical protein